MTKRAAYEVAGLPSYWVVDPTAPSLLALRLGPTGTYDVEADISGDGAFDTEQPFPLWVDLRHLVAP